MNQIFISHIAEEASIAIEIKNLILSKFKSQIQVFVSSDILDNPLGIRWFEKMEVALNESQVMLILCSPLSVSMPWINFEAGCGWINKKIVIPICHSGQHQNELPIPIRLFEATDLESSNFVLDLIRSIAKHYNFRKPNVDNRNIKKFYSDLKNKKALISAQDVAPMIINSPLERTKFVIEDLRKLADLRNQDLAGRTIYSIAHLSAFAISSNEEEYRRKEYLDLLLQEKGQLISLAQRGCTIKCMISPSKSFERKAALLHNRLRLSELINFLKNGDACVLNNIDWVISEFGGLNIYIIDNISCFEGYTKSVEGGYQLTLRITTHDVINANEKIFERLFIELSFSTLRKWLKDPSDTDYSRKNLRQATINCLEDYYKSSYEILPAT